MKLGKQSYVSDFDKISLCQLRTAFHWRSKQQEFKKKKKRIERHGEGATSYGEWMQ